MPRIVAALATLAILGSGLPGVARAQDCAGEPQASSPTRLEVEVEGIQPARGEVAVTVYPDDARRFLASRGKLARQRLPVRGSTVSACFWLPARGHYAVAVYHDVNANHDFDRNLLGLPAEGFGFSNDAPTKVGLPPFSAVRFPATKAETMIRIRVRYLR